LKSFFCDFENGIIAASKYVFFQIHQFMVVYFTTANHYGARYKNVDYKKTVQTIRILKEF
jgi:hypothetical protein